LVNVRLFNITGVDSSQILMDTIGLSYFGLPDFQILYKAPYENDIARLLWNSAYYIFEKGNGSKLPVEYLAKITLILDALDAFSSENDIKALGGGIHMLTGNYAGFWSIKVSPNYRIVFRYSNGEVFDIDYVDYHSMGGNTMLKRALPSAHLGTVLRELFMNERSLTITDLAKGLGMTRANVSAVVNGRQAFRRFR